MLSNQNVLISEELKEFEEKKQKQKEFKERKEKIEFMETEKYNENLKKEMDKMADIWKKEDEEEAIREKKKREQMLNSSEPSYYIDSLIREMRDEYEAKRKHEKYNIIEKVDMEQRKNSSNSFLDNFKLTEKDKINFGKKINLKEKGETFTLKICINRKLGEMKRELKNAYSMRNKSKIIEIGNVTKDTEMFKIFNILNEKFKELNMNQEENNQCARIDFEDETVYDKKNITILGGLLYTRIHENPRLIVPSEVFSDIQNYITDNTIYCKVYGDKKESVKKINHFVDIFYRLENFLKIKNKFVPVYHLDFFVKQGVHPILFSNCYIPENKKINEIITNSLEKITDRNIFADFPMDSTSEFSEYYNIYAVDSLFFRLLYADFINNYKTTNKTTLEDIRKNLPYPNFEKNLVNVKLYKDDEDTIFTMSSGAWKETEKPIFLQLLELKEQNKLEELITFLKLKIKKVDPNSVQHNIRNWYALIPKTMF